MAQIPIVPPFGECWTEVPDHTLLAAIAQALSELAFGSSGGAPTAPQTVIGPISTTATGSTVNVTATTGIALAANANRKYAVLCNSGTNDVTILRGGTVVSGSGILLKAGGGSYEINSTNLYLGAISCICASTLTSTLSIEEDV